MKKAVILFFLHLLIAISGFTQKAYNDEKLITAGAFGKSMAIGLTVNSANRIFVSFPNYDGDGFIALAELKNGKLMPFPDKEWNSTLSPAHFVRVQDLETDAADNLWVLDSKPAAGGNIFGDGKGNKEGQFALIKIDTRTGTVKKKYFFNDIDKSKSALNDVRIDLKNNLAYLSDPGQAAIIILDLEKGTSRKVLSNTPYTLADNIVLKYDGKEMRDKNGKPFTSHVNSIALTTDFNYFYFKPINKNHLYRIATRYLADTFMTEKELESKVEDMGEVGITHGLIADKKGNIFLTNSEQYSILYLSPDGELHTLIKDKRLLWPDSFGIGTDGYLYVSCSQLQRLPQWNNGIDKTQYPYQIYKVKLPD